MAPTRASTRSTECAELFVPLYCRMVEIGDEPALLAFFDDDDGTERAAVPFCYEARRHPEAAPRLVFQAEKAPLAQEYDCDARDFGRPVRLSEIGDRERGSAE